MSTYIREPGQEPHILRGSGRGRAPEYARGPEHGHAPEHGHRIEYGHGHRPQDSLPGERTRAPQPAVSGTVVPADSVDSQSLSALAWILDDLIRIPGINVRVGLDAMIGLVPGIGDSIGTALSSIILVSSVRYRVPMHVLLQMAWNILVDTVLGLIPGVGDVADAVHRANRKNYRLLRETVESGKQVDASSKGYVIRAGLLVAGVIAALVAATLLTLWVIFQGLGALFG